MRPWSTRPATIGTTAPTVGPVVGLGGDASTRNRPNGSNAGEACTRATSSAVPAWATTRPSGVVTKTGPARIAASSAARSARSPPSSTTETSARCTSSLRAASAAWRLSRVPITSLSTSSKPTPCGNSMIGKPRRSASASSPAGTSSR